MAVSQRELALQMIAQLRVLDPSISVEVGTPERKIIDTVAQSLYDNQIDLDALSGALDLDGKFGAALDRFLALFGFTRQKATFATGFVTFSRVTASSLDIRIPAGTIVTAPAELDARPSISGDDATQDIAFQTIYDVTLPAGATEIAAPIRAMVGGKIGNVATNRITQITSAAFGITSVTNTTPTAGGLDAETDDEYKVRFRNTVFRNLAGTEDQYLALAIATAFSTKANVIGPQSFWREYIQVPEADDTSAIDVLGNNSPVAGSGSAGQYTTALTTIPFAKYVYATEFPVFVTNGTQGGSIYFRQDVDFILNTSNDARNRGDAFRYWQPGVGLDVEPAGTTRPNATFLNVYTGTSSGVDAVRPGDLLLLEFSYLSETSRNDLELGVTNAVDVFIDGTNQIFASTVTVRPTTANVFIDNPDSPRHYENFRRVGDPGKRPVLGHVWMPLFWQPVVDLPEQIVVGTDAYLKDVHYWAIEDVSPIGGTIRSRGGIEWTPLINGIASGDDEDDDPSLWTGKLITDTAGDPVGGQPVEIDDYIYDKNIVDLQAALEGAKQVTTDVLAHKARIRYFKLDLTIMYQNGASVTDTNLAIRDAVDAYLKGLYFGSAIQLSDILTAVHNVGGVDNVRWTKDMTGVIEAPRVYEVNRAGVPLVGVATERVQPGTGARQEIQYIYINGQPDTGSAVFSYGVNLGASIDLTTLTAATLQTNLNAITSIGFVTVVEDARTTIGVRNPIRSFRVAWTTAAGNGIASPGQKSLLGVTTDARGGDFWHDNDFYLRDDELGALSEDLYTPPNVSNVSGVRADTMAGLIIRPRAQGTWTKAN